ncbi:flagellar hook-basal body protein [Acidaminobacter hydrogenoformans]|uniref:Flagellar hook protein FlgE n=1 Tax=Acidaminobacter hydrogenoformans DSM 2784 TaxID=1120920 RepID=A0A1G5RWU6_9FIRM|nr:flagellar hook-basal body complex protein [Acidaminobacter hydrogenoformans]SCZ77789.1 flagellar hook protein FlgE [Acidaminobacter hydrogenoformans DSM 2784]
MLRSMYSGVSGMRSYQTKMDVIGNNIANVGTTAFKSSAAQFQDLLSETLSTAQAPIEDGLGGINAKQVGLGVSVGKISTIMSNGALQPTGRDLDFALEGSGFFIVSDNPKPDGAFEYKYTRDGSFQRDSNGTLTMGGGLSVMGISSITLEGDPAEAVHDTGGLSSIADAEKFSAIIIPDKLDPQGELVSFTIDGTGKIKARYSEAGEDLEIGQVAVARFVNPGGLEKMGGNTYAASQNSGEAAFGTSGIDGFGIIRKGYLEMSNVDLANEFTEMIITSRSYQANSRTITTSDEMLQELLNLKR